MDWMPAAIRDGILTVLLISGPVVVIAASLGLIVGVVQAATQVQEQTLGSAVKILGVFVTLILGGFWMFTYIRKYTHSTFTTAFRRVPNLEAHPLPPRRLSKKKIGEDIPPGMLLPSLNEESPGIGVMGLPSMNEEFTEAMGGSNASAFADFAKQPDVIPINQGESLRRTAPQAAPKKETQADLSTQGLSSAEELKEESLARLEAKPVEEAPKPPAKPARKPVSKPAPSAPARPAPARSTSSRRAPARASTPTRTSIPARRASTPTRSSSTTTPKKSPGLKRSSVGDITRKIRSNR